MVISASNLSISHGPSEVLSGAGFEMEAGSFAYLIGRTGSGKSSLLKTLYADMPLRSGSLTVAGQDLADRPSLNQIAALRRKLGIIFQDFQLLPDRSVADNLSFVLRATGTSDKARIRNRIEEISMEVGLSAAVTKMPYQLSGGEQQRVCIARALLNDPVLLLADEPTGNLDPEVSLAILELFRRINRRGTAVLMATHNLQFLRDQPARVLQCKDGKLFDSAREDVSYTG